VLVVALLAAGCGSSGSSGHSGKVRSRTVSTATRTAPATLTATAPVRLAAAPAGPPPGTTQHIEADGASLSVTLQQVIDPLGGSGAALPPGTRAVGVLMAIANAGPAIYDSSATADITVVAASGSVTPVLATAGVCQTPLNDWDRYLTASAHASGCVVLAVGSHTRLRAVRFDPHGQSRAHLSWAP
jgi:hypothetical protein